MNEGVCDDNQCRRCEKCQLFKQHCQAFLDQHITLLQFVRDMTLDPKLRHCPYDHWALAEKDQLIADVLLNKGNAYSTPTLLNGNNVSGYVILMDFVCHTLVEDHYGHNGHDNSQKNDVKDHNDKISNVSNQSDYDHNLKALTKIQKLKQKLKALQKVTRLSMKATRLSLKAQRLLLRKNNKTILV